MEKTDFSKMTEGEALWHIGVRPARKDGKIGINVPVPGRETLFIPASDEKPDVIIASHRKQDRLKGAKEVRCADCRCKVWISPSTQKVLKQYPRTPVICIACCLKRADKEKAEEGQ